MVWHCGIGGASESCAVPSHGRLSSPRRVSLPGRLPSLKRLSSPGLCHNISSSVEAGWKELQRITRIVLGTCAKRRNYSAETFPDSYVERLPFQNHQIYSIGENFLVLSSLCRILYADIVTKYVAMRERASKRCTILSVLTDPPLIPAEPTSGGGCVCAEQTNKLPELQARFQPKVHYAGGDSATSQTHVPHG
jgi:hypothetical protein